MKLHAAVRMSAHLRVPETEMWERVGPGTESQGPVRCDWVLPCHQNQCQNILTIHHKPAESSDEKPHYSGPNKYLVTVTNV